MYKVGCSFVRHSYEYGSWGKQENLQTKTSLFSIYHLRVSPVHCSVLNEQSNLKVRRSVKLGACFPPAAQTLSCPHTHTHTHIHEFWEVVSFQKWSTSDGHNLNDVHYLPRWRTAVKLFNDTRFQIPSTVRSGGFTFGVPLNAFSAVRCILASTESLNL